MAPLRRYLRITKYSVLECRIYLDNPALAHSWLLNHRDPVLPRVIEAVRPLVLPKLREERERSRKKSTKKRGIKDTVVEDDFEVSIFLTETPTRHSLLYKHKHFRDTTQTKLTSTSVRLTSASREAPIDLDGLETAEQSDDATRVAPSRGDGEDPPAPGRASSPTSLAPAVVFRTEDDDDDVVVLADIPSIDERGGPPAAEDTSRAPKRRRGRSGARAEAAQGSAGRDASGPAYALGSDEEIDDRSEDTDDGLFVTQEDEEDALDEDGTVTPPAKRRRAQAEASESGAEHEETRDDKKKLAMDISYEGFAIYGRVLCLVVKRRDGPGSITSSTSTAKGKGVAGAPSGRGGRAGQQAAAPGGQAVMENWITSTQMPADAVALGAAEAP